MSTKRVTPPNLTPRASNGAPNGRPTNPRRNLRSLGRNRRLAKHRRVLQVLRKAATFLLATRLRAGLASTIALFAAATIRHRLRGGEIQVSPLSVPATLASLGVSGHELTARLIEHVDSIREAASLTSGQSRWVIETPEPYPNVEVPWLGIPASVAFDLFDQFGRHHGAQVSWEMTARRLSDQRVDEWALSASVSGGRLHEVRFSPQNPDSALAAIAEAIIGDAEPYTAIRALNFAGRCDDARALARKELVRARTIKQRVVANTFMGFVSECSFAESTANDEEAAWYYREAIRIDPNEPQPHASLARLLADHGDEASEQEFTKAQRLAPNVAATYEAWGYALMLAYKYDDAAPKFRRAIQLDQHSSAYNNLGFLFLDQHQIDSAMAYFALGVDRHADPAALKAYGRLLLTKGRFQFAADMFRRAARLSPSDADSRYWLGVALDSAAQTDAARRAFSEVMSVAKEGDPYCTAARRYLSQKTPCGGGKT